MFYTGKDLNNDLKSIISEFKPTIRGFPDSNDNLSDHMITYAFIKQGAIETGYSGKNYKYIVHKEYLAYIPYIFSMGEIKT